MASAQKCGGVQKKITPNITSAGQLDGAGDRGPADDHRHAARRAAPDDVLRGAPLQQQRVDEARRTRSRATARPAASRFVVEPEPRRTDSTPSTSAEDQRVARRAPGPWASGRRAVRFIFASMSASTTQFSALRAGRGHRPAEQRGERSATATGCRAAARNIAGTVTTSSCSMIRGLGERRGRRAPCREPRQPARGRRRQRHRAGPAGHGHAHRRPRSARSARELALRPVDRSRGHADRPSRVDLVDRR